jgi:hypothetical protein
LAVEVAGLAAVFVGVIEGTGFGELDAGELGVRDGEKEEVFFGDEGGAGFVAEACGGEGAEEFFGGPLGGVDVGEGGGDVRGVGGVVSEGGEGGVDVFLGEGEVGAAEDDFLQGRAVGVGFAMGVDEGTDIGGDLICEGGGEGGVAFDDAGEGGAAVLGDGGGGASGEAAGALDGFGVGAAGAGADGGEDGDAAVLWSGEEAAGSGFDDADDEDGEVQFFDEGAEVFEAVGGGSVAGDDEGFDGGFGLGTGRGGVGGVVAVAEEEEGVFEDEFAKVGEVVFSGVVAVGHVGLVAEVDEAFVFEVGMAVGPGGEGVVVEGVDFEDFFEDSEAADAGVEDADGEVGEVG